MTLQELISAEIPQEKLSLLSKENLMVLVKGGESYARSLERRIKTLEAAQAEMKQQKLWVEEQFLTIKREIFGKSSERAPRDNNQEEQSPEQPDKPKKKRVLLPSERYPNAPLLVEDVTLDTPPTCGCCQQQMEDSGMTEDSEFLTVFPKQYVVVRQCRHKYRCKKCYGDLKTAPLPPRIKPGSSMSDPMVIDVALTKYCDLIPIERYSKIAERSGIKDLPPQSLIESTHHLADFVKPVYEKLKSEVLAVPWYLHADETPHKMLEGDETSNWFLWGFSAEKASYFECHDTRSGDVASDFLAEANCEFLVSDVYSGYGKAVRVANDKRREENRPLIEHVYCNAHVRRYFKQAGERHPNESKFYVDQYTQIYRLEEQAKGKTPEEVLSIRSQMQPCFEAIKKRAMEDLPRYPDKSKLAKAMKYFLKNEEGFTRFLKNARLPIDNNPAERLLRNPVIGRKTWYGTHSKRGAETAAILFSLVESCKLAKINPREYFRQLVSALHAGKPVFTPKELSAQ
jgi:transposase